MRRSALFFALLLIAGSAFADERIARSRHVIFSPARPLTEAQWAALSARGIERREALTNGRVLLRIPPGAGLDETLGSIEPLTAAKKLHRSALREAAKAKVYANVSIHFHQDVPFEAAKATIAAHGGAIEDPLQLDFGFRTRIRARIAPAALTQLAADERVLLVYGPLRLLPQSDNRVSGQISRVDVVQAPPYNLSGAGVAMSYFELGRAEQEHREFEGRLILHITGGGASDASHATHTAGTMIAAGIDAAAKGMAPKATLHEYDVNEGDYETLLARKSQLPTLGVVVDNNSWSYILGWCRPGACKDGNGNTINAWNWLGKDGPAELYGAYDSFISGTLDQIARTASVLMIHSAGNDAEKTGPGFAPFSHRHRGDNTNTYCYSANGTGTDCLAPCSTGADFCEITRHPQISPSAAPPWTSIGVTASAKNVLTVGAIDVEKGLAAFSSRGPTLDGRLKPDVVARGVNTWSTNSGGGYVIKNGTSMAAPVVAGITALLVEQWRNLAITPEPTPAVLKTLILAGAEDIGNPGPDYAYGYGLADAKASVDLIIADGGAGRRIRTESVAQDGELSIPLTLNATQKLRVALGWHDPEVLDVEAALDDATLVNDLDLQVIDPLGNPVLPYKLDKATPNAAATRGVNTIDNSEMVEIANATAGSYRVVVKGTRVTAFSPQSFVVVANGDFPVVCRDEANNSETSAFVLASGETRSGNSCDTADADYFRFVANRPGTVSVAVTATDVPLRVTLTSAATPATTVDVAAGTTQTASVQFGGTTAVIFIVKIEPAGSTAAMSTYTIRPTYIFEAGPRRRAVRR
jgi:hypothetical protein